MNYPKKFAFAALATMSVATAGCMSMGDTMAMDEQVAYVDGAAMYPTMNIIENAVNSPIHTTLVAAVKQAQLVDTLSGPDRSPYSHPPTKPSRAFLNPCSIRS